MNRNKYECLIKSRSTLRLHIRSSEICMTQPSAELYEGKPPVCGNLVQAEGTEGALLHRGVHGTSLEVYFYIFLPS